MKRQKKNLIAVLSFLSLLSMSNVNIFAKESIPNSMSPNTLIKYTDEKNYTILNETEKKNNEFNKDTFKEVGSSNLSIDDSKVIVANYPDPCKGMYVKYGSDGLVSKIYILKDSKENVTNNVSYQDKNSKRQIK